MEKSDQIQRSNKKLRKSNVHVKLTDEELNTLGNEMAYISIDSHSSRQAIKSLVQSVLPV
ncbi:hypothetical protein AVEN109717_04360 [Avibacterium endocarditidis]